MPDEIKNPIDLIPEEHQTEFRNIWDKCRTEHDFIRYAQVRQWKKQEEFWHGVQQIYWSETAHEWRTVDTAVEGVEESRDRTGPVYDHVINIYKPHGESIIAALSQQVPVVEFFPDDADVAADLSTAKTKTDIALLIQKHNASKLLLMEALHKLFNTGLVCGYVHPKADKDYGMREVPVYNKQPFDVNYGDCPTCGARLGEMETPEPTTCPVCESEMIPNMVTESEERVVQTGVKEVPKARTIIELFSPLNVKIPYYIKEQKQAGYILQFLEENFAFVRDTYPWIRDKISPTYSKGSTDRWTRSPSTFANYFRSETDESSLVTVEKLWLRPWMFEYCEDKDRAAELKEIYPNGVKLIYVGDELAEVTPENLDEYWEIGKSGPSTYIHSDPLGLSLVEVQELRNDTVNLTVETVEYGIPVTFADPEVLNLDEYSATEVSPGSVYPAKPRPGKNLGDSFHDSKTATLAKEVEPFLSHLDQDGQFVTGDVPSIYGGATEASSRTASEYQMQKQSALQRLSLSWEYLRIWWTHLIEKSVNCFIKNMVEDERYVTKEGGLYTNILINRADLIGKANVNAEASEHFPISALQKKQVLLELMQMQIPEIQEVIANPENNKNIAAALGFPDLYIPGQDQRYKQLSEIAQLVKIDNAVTPDMLPTVPNEPEIDDDEIHLDICKIYLASERGQTLKRINPAAYLNVSMHAVLHKQRVDELLQQQAMVQMPSQVETK